MQIQLKTLLTEYADEMHAGNAALFIGAGLSRPGGFVDWKELLFDIAKEINLEIVREQHDLVAVVQYYLNRRGGDRSYLNKVLTDAFDKPGVRTDNHQVIARLPIPTIWTTNFDRLIEGALREAHRSYDLKTRDPEIARSTKGRDVVLYKMHGDIAQTDQIIICQDDYERYARQHPIFQNVLEGDLLTKTFLFLGFSFTDPNLRYMLGHLRSLLEGNKRQHYTIMRKVRYVWDIDEVKAQDDFEYEANKQTHQIDNLDRYSIDTLLVEHYDQVTEILNALEQKYYERNIYVSGGARDDEQFRWQKLNEFNRQLGRRLIKENRRLFSDFRSSVGRALLAGALPELYQKELSIEKYLLSPLPTRMPAERSEAAFGRACREEMITKCGFAIYVGGSGSDYEEVMHDFEFSKGLKTIPIPIGVSGTAARDIWEKIQPTVETCYQRAVPARTFAKLNDDSLDEGQLLDAVFEIIDKMSKREPELAKRSDEETRRTVFAKLRKDYPNLPSETLREIVGHL